MRDTVRVIRGFHMLELILLVIFLALLVELVFGMLAVDRRVIGLLVILLILFALFGRGAGPRWRLCGGHSLNLPMGLDSPGKSPCEPA